jgi:O-antigen ligase
MHSGIHAFPAASPQVLENRADYNSLGTARRFCKFSATLFLTQVLICVLPPAVLFAAGKVALAGYTFFALLGILLLRLAFAGRRDELLCLILAAGPFMNLLRGFAFYNVVIAVFVLGLFYYFAVSSGTVRDTLKKVPLVWSLTFFITVFYLLSLINTHNYAINVRLFELVFSVICVLVIGRIPALLAAALLGNLLSACSVGMAMLPNMVSGGRLGMIETTEQTLGNPTQLGIPLALGFLALSLDRGRWLNLQGAPLLRLLLLFPVMALLALTTSRAAWLVAAGGIFLAIMFGHQQRLKMWIVLALSAVAIFAVLHSPYGPTLQRGLKRTFGEEESMRHRTSGRSDQWKVAWYAFNCSLETMIRGYGPGTGAEVYAKYSGLVDGVKYGVGKKVALHSLFMQIGVEAGLAGLTLLLAWLAVCFWKVARNTLQSGAIFLFVCFFSYLFIVVTVSGSDTNSGMFLGLALLGTVGGMAAREATLSPMEKMTKE